MNLIGKFVFLVIIAGVALEQAPLTTEEAAKLKAKVVAECKAKLKDLSEDEFDNIINKRIPAVTTTGNCFIACMLRNLSYMNPDFSINDKNLLDRLDRTKDQAPAEEYPKKVKLINFCKSKETKESDECEAARKFIMCVVDQKKTLVITTRLW